MKNQQHFLSVIVPVYKQEKTIVKNLRLIKNVLDKIRYSYEIIAVVDGIIDHSLKKIKQAKFVGLKTLGYLKNQGKSYAIRLGMTKARGDFVMFIDSGMEIDPNGISMLLEHMEWYEADIIVGSKRHPASFIHYSLLRKFLSLGYYAFVKLLYNFSAVTSAATLESIFRIFIDTLAIFYRKNILHYYDKVHKKSLN